MTDLRELFARQAEWQRARRSLSWAEKMRMAEAVRDSIAALRRAAVRPDRNERESGRLETPHSQPCEERKDRE